MKNIARVTIFALLPVALAFFASLALAGEVSEPVPTYRYMMVYGTGNLQVGDMVEFFTPAEVLCGQFVVGEAGAYGLMSIYGDDSSTDRVEGAQPGEDLTVRVNGAEVQPLRGNPVWREGLDSLRVDL